MCILCLIWPLVASFATKPQGQHIITQTNSEQCISPHFVAKLGNGGEVLLILLVLSLHPSVSHVVPPFIACLLISLFSTKVTDTARQECDGETSCEVNVLSFKELGIDEVAPQQSNCRIDGRFYSQSIQTEFMVVEYRCQGKCHILCHADWTVFRL